MTVLTKIMPLALLAAASASAAAANAPKAGTYTVDAVHSFTIFKIHHFGAGFVYGWFKETSGKFVVDADPRKSSLELTIKADSIDTHDAKRDEHLKSSSYFNAMQFPTITFKSTKVVPAADGQLEVTGDLTIRGKTKSVTAKVSPTGAGEDPQMKYRGGFEGHVTIDRNDFGLGFLPGALGDNVEVTLALEGVAQ
jgi:polyisoprenoid-binding protein YceI